MLHGIILAAALACPGHTVADFNKAVASPPADHVVQLTEAQQRLFAPAGFTVEAVEGPGVGEGRVLLVLIQGECVNDMAFLSLDDFTSMLAKHSS